MPTVRSGDERTSPTDSPGSDASLILTATLPEASGERSHFYFFKQRTAPELSGYLDAEFYNAIMLQMSRNQPAIRHAVIALGALHESVKTHDRVRSDLKTLSLRHYTKAIQELAKSSKERSQSVCVTLICCVLFIWIETLQKNHSLRMQQLTAGLKILSEWQRDVVAFGSTTSEDVQFIQKQLVPIFTRMDLQGVSFEHGRTPQLALHLRLENPRSRGIPAAFTSVAEARDWEDVILYWLHNAMRGHKECLQPGRLPVQVEGQLLLEQWDLALNEFLRVKQNISDSEIRACNILRIYQKISVIMLGTRMSRKEMDYEPFNANMEDIMDILESLFEASRGTGALDGYQFSFEMGVVAPLFYVSSKCVDQEVRTKALMMLLKCPRKGGVWDGLGVAKMTSLSPDGVAKDVTIGEAKSNEWVKRYDAAMAVQSSSPGATCSQLPT